ncbi:MAG TPA: phytoene/squalene synthase family protein [Candidatus Saccharimonadales bacterium]|nr:phytoene/squalene synthase family protein [Candidatus Saccharimonadales bacterium]
MAAELKTLLKATSRSFYLTLRVLPARVRPQIGLAYLLARTTDTIADTEIVPLGQRLDALQELRARILGKSTTPLNFAGLAKQQVSSAERLLLEKVENSLALLQKLSAADLQRVRGVLDIIAGGQELDLQRFAGASAENIIALKSGIELDDYTYRVAGCVGEFWTQLCRAHLFPRAELEDAQLFGDSIRFGKGLQLVNILRDLAADLHKGRCYLPSLELDQVGLIPSVLLSPVNESRFRPLYHRYLDVAESHLQAGWNYTNALPRGQMRVRLACAWPILIGVRTIQRLRAANVLELRRGIKISRSEVRGILLRSALAYPLRGAWRKLFVTSRKAVASA